MTRARLISASTVVVLAIAVPAVTAQEAVVVTGGTVIDGTGAAPVKDAVVVIEGSRITAVGPRSGVRIPAGAREVNVAGKFVIPGLMDANMHHVLNMTIEFHARYEERYEDLIEEAAQVALRNGVTTVFDSWGPLQPLLNVRDRIRRGEVVGSRMFVAGNIVGLSGPLGRDFNPLAETIATKALVTRINHIYEENVGPALLWRTPDEVRTEIRRYIARGIDFLKYAASGHGSTRTRSSTHDDFLMFSPEAQRAIVEECHRAGISVQTHAMTVESLRQAIEAGVDMGQHIEYTGDEAIPDATIQMMLDRKMYAAVQAETARRRELNIENAGNDTVAAADFRMRHENILRLMKAGVPLLLATDAGLRDPDGVASQNPKGRIDQLSELHEGEFMWFKAMQENGMKPMDAIVAATRNIAVAYHKLDLGTLEKGKTADLVVLDADPLRDISNIRQIALVMKDGRVVDRDKLPFKRVLGVSRDDRNAVLGVQQQFAEAYRTCDVQRMGSLVTDDLLLLHSTGTLQNKAEFLKGVAACNYDEMAIEPDSVRFYGDAAIVMSSMPVRIKKSSTVHPGLGLTLLVTEVFVKQKGRWLLASHQTTEAIPGGTSLKVAPDHPLGAYAPVDANVRSSNGADRDAVVGVAKQFTEAYRTCDTQEMGRVVTEDVLYRHSVGTLQNKDQLLKGIAGCRYDEMAIEPDNLRIYGDVAILIGRHPIKAKKTVVGGLTVTLLVGEVFVKQNGRWLFASHQTTEPIPVGTSQALSQ
jgi:imidazolonepropionase-like amidohydrolase/ketosteroid isomerase-like protein